MISTPFDPKNTSGSHTSFWLDSVGSLPRFHPLNKSLKVDVVIVGGGLAGVSIGYCLASAGKQVAIVEDGQIGSGETGRTTAHLVTALDDRYHRLEKIWGESDTKLIARSHKEAIDFIEKSIQAENIECFFERISGYLLLHPTDEADALQKEYEAAYKAGLDVHLRQELPGINYPGPVLEFTDQGQFHPLLYIKGLCKAIITKGGKIFSGTHADVIDHTGIATSEGFEIKADHVVVATNSPVNNLVGTHLKQTAHRTYVVGATIKKDILPRALWWDTGDHSIDKHIPPYHYVRVQPYNEEFDLLISGGEDHPTGDVHNGVEEENRYQALESWTRQYFPVEEIVYRWSGQVMEPVDSLAFIGRNPMDKDNVYIVTGDSGTGMTHCTIAGMLIRDLIIGNENPFEHLYKPSRITFETGGIFFKEMMRGLAGVLRGTTEADKAKRIGDIKPGEGKITSVDGHKCGVYIDEQGHCHIVAARCAHLKAMLEWNGAEKTWDCPWHGSRFTVDGEVINGPAIHNLAVYHESEGKVVETDKK
jgi:glycine/D-amino acid oxidase-like deaminating enzyme/nitrite reductase/ring-hydroxylating ferredoxin subunit